MKTTQEQEWQRRELANFFNTGNAYHDSAREFSDHIAEGGEEWVTEQIEWIENGSYGAGACFALQRARQWGEQSKRRNTAASVGRVVILALAGREYAWPKLTAAAKNILTASVAAWLKRKPTYAADCILPI